MGQESDEAFNRGNALAGRGRHAEAEAEYREALRLAPGDFEAMSNLAGCLGQLGRLDEAIALYGTALALQPGEAPLHANLSAALRAAGRFEESAASLRRLLELEPQRAEAHRNLGWHLLSLGRFAEGWAEYRWRAGAAPRLPPRGSPLHLAGGAGLGDTLFFLRFAARLAGPLTAHVDARLVPLLERSRLFARVVPQEPAATGAIPVGDLPLLTGMTRAEDAPPPFPLTARPDLRAALQAELAALGPPPYLGVLWRSGTRGEEGSLLKQLPAETLGAALRGVPGTVLVLQREAEAGELARFTAALGREAHDLGAEQGDLERLLALLDLLEHYVGPSSTAVHMLAGLGRGARVLVPMPPEWRWMAAGAASPWFPGSRVYRQGADGSWSAALEALRTSILDGYPVT